MYGRRESARIDATRVAALIHDGFSLKIEGLDQIHPTVRAATDDVHRFISAPTSCNVIVSGAHGNAFTPHFDEVDIFVVQCEGTKSWKVHGVGEPFPMEIYQDSDVARCPSHIVFEDLLRPGDILHVPRGWWHTVCSAGEPTLHLAFCCARRTGYDWLRWILSRSLASDKIRESLNGFGDGSARAAQIGVILEEFYDVAANSSMEDFFCAERTTMRARPNLSLPWTAADVAPTRSCVVALALNDPEWIEADGTLTVRAGNKEYRFTRDIGSVMRVLLERRSSTVSMLAAAAEVTSSRCSSLVLKLARLGLVSVRSSEARPRPPRGSVISP
jgi:hypothetical protein